MIDLPPKLESAVDGAARFAVFLSRAIPKLQAWWNARQDRKLEDQLDALDAALGRSFDHAREALREKYEEPEEP